MKNFVLVLIFVLSFFIFILNRTGNKTNYIADKSNNVLKLQSSSPSKLISNNQINKTFKDANSGGLEQPWYNKVVKNIVDEEYYVSYSEDLMSYQSPNRANNIRFIYHNDGFTAKARVSKIPLFDLNDRLIREEDKKYKQIPEWSIRFKTSNIKRWTDTKASECSEKLINVNSALSEKIVDNSIQFTGSEIKVDKNKASVEDDNIRIDYTNTEKGMRQDFLIKQAPRGEGKLQLELSAETSLRMLVEKDALRFKDKNGNEKVEYSSLKVWDANGKELSAHFEKLNIKNENGKIPSSPSGGQIKNQKSKIVNNDQLTNQQINQFAIVVNDEDAIYPITIDPLSTSPDWISEGNQTDAAFGYSVSTAGDVNGDGYSDVIIGAFLYDNGQTDEGRAFVYNGSNLGLLSMATWTAEGNQTNAHFGCSVSTAGDVNNDGYSDVIVGAKIFDNDQVDEGRVFVYYGSILGLSLNPSWTAESNQGGSQFGFTVSTAGDINNDNYSDVIIGSPLYDNGVLDEGRAFVYYGSPTGLSGAANWTAESNQQTALFGYSVSTAGDVNGDGYSDVIIGSNRYDTPILDEGRAFIYYGSSGGLSLTPNWASESNPSAFFVYYGNSVSTAGDVNDDGYSDVIVGAYSWDNVEPDEGKVFVYHGSSAGISTTANWAVESNQAYARFGNSVSTAGDVNNDGYSDVIVGASEYDNGESNEGRAFVYFGSSTGLSSLPGWTAESNQANSLFGVSVASAGDVNNDNYSDVIVGAYLYDNGQSNEGGAFVYYGTGASMKILSLRMFIQGFYNSSNNQMVQDTLRVYLRNSSAPFAIVDSAKAVLNQTGYATLNFANATNGVNYYLHLKHRNSIETWSKTPQSFNSSVMTYDFSTSITQAYGDNMIQVDASPPPPRFAIYSGDVNQDGVIDGSDIQRIDNDATFFLTGYLPTDLNGDGVIDGGDALFGENNAGKYVLKITP